MIINNHHPEDIIIVIDNITYKLSAHSSLEITVECFSTCCQLIHDHNLSDWTGELSDQMLRTFSKITAIIVDSEYIISEIKEATILDITNEMETYEKDDACIIYHGVIAKNAKIELKNCYSPNARGFLAARKWLLLSDADDFPIISPIISINRYHRIKKIVAQRNLWNIVCAKTTFTSI